MFDIYGRINFRPRFWRRRQFEDSGSLLWNFFIETNFRYVKRKKKVKSDFQLWHTTYETTKTWETKLVIFQNSWCSEESHLKFLYPSWSVLMCLFRCSQITVVISLFFMDCLNMFLQISWFREGFFTRVTFIISLSFMN